MKRKKWIATLTVVLVLAGAALVWAKSRDKTDANKTESTPFRLGKVQAEDLQVSVREVGVVDPEIKVDVKSAVSGRVLGLKRARGRRGPDRRRAGRGRAGRQPGAVALGRQVGVKDAELELRDTERELARCRRRCSSRA